jgi:diadenylate cyclase
MRHKAAIGVTEVSDAVSVVVSEETGAISIAYEGQLESDIDRTELKQKLTGYMKK